MQQNVLHVYFQLQIFFLRIFLSGFSRASSIGLSPMPDARVRADSMVLLHDNTDTSGNQAARQEKNQKTPDVEKVELLHDNSLLGVEKFVYAKIKFLRSYMPPSHDKSTSALLPVESMSSSSSSSW